MSVPWSTSQREWLRALGLPVLALSAGEGGPEEADADVGDPAAASAPMPDPAAPGRMRVPEPPMRPVRAELPEMPAQAPAAPAGGTPGRMGDRLYRALLRATARRTPREGEAMLRTVTFDLDALRAEPARKRELWMRLRAARKAARG